MKTTREKVLIISDGTTAAVQVQKTNGTVVNVIDADGNIDAPVTTTDLTTTGNTTLGNASTDTNTLNGVTSVANKFILSGVESIAAGGTTTALDLTKSVHLVDADAGGDIFTLAAGVAGQIMTITMLSSTGVATITPSALAGGASVTFNALGDSVVLQYISSKWYIIGGNSYAIV